jgi:hypothetical protein
MARASVRIKMSFEINDIICDGENESEVIDSIIDNEIIQESILDRAYDSMVIVEAEYDELEPPEEDEENDKEDETV